MMLRVKCRIYKSKVRTTKLFCLIADSAEALDSGADEHDILSGRVMAGNIPMYMLTSEEYQRLMASGLQEATEEEELAIMEAFEG